MFRPTIKNDPFPMLRIICFSLFIILTSITTLSAQDKQYKVACVGFYNFENLFDTEDDPLIRDEEFTPTGGKGYTEELYKEKLGNLEKVVAQVGTEMTPDGLAILGVSEIENRKVLEDFVKQPKLVDRNYQIVHFDSPDKRGIDVALLYQPKYFTFLNARKIDMTTPRGENDTLFTRDILLVSGEIDGDVMHFLVNHWPSRSGGEARSKPGRALAALKNKEVCDSIFQIDPKAKIVIMGDLNDDPVSPSVKDVLQARGKKHKVKKTGFYNPMTDFYKKGLGTTAWRDAWSLFDQLIVSEGLLNPTDKEYKFYKAKVFNQKFMTQKTGQFKGYPLRTFVGDQYMGGYSDHFPVYLYMVKEI